MARPQTHLGDVARSSPEPNGTRVILPLVTAGLNKLRQQEEAERIAERGSTAKTNPHVSDAGKCPRKVVLSLMNTPESDPLDVDSLLRFAVGHSFEDAIARILEAQQGAKILREERVEIKAKGTKITGRKDFSGVLVALDDDTVLELKSSNARAVGFLVSRGKPNDDHVAQLNLYLHATGKKCGYLVYLVAGATKGEPMLHSWRVDYDRGRALADVASLEHAAQMAAQKNPPPIPPGLTRTTFPCSYCSYRGFCWGGK